MSTINPSLINSLTSNSSSPSSGSSSTANSSNLSLTPSDFINLMVTQLQNQDPTNPTSSTDLLTQMSEIGQLQSSNSLQTTLSSLTLQTQIGSAGNLIGKSVTGLDDSKNTVSGTVNSVSVHNSNVYLQLDDGSSLQLGNVSKIAAPAAGASTAGASTTTGA